MLVFSIIRLFLPCQATTEGNPAMRLCRRLLVLAITVTAIALGLQGEALAIGPQLVPIG